MTGVITIDHLTKRFGSATTGVLAVDGLSVRIAPGRVTGFLGPNGAGKTTTLRCLLGLVRPTSGTALFEGQRYENLADPVRSVGAALEASSFYPGRRARDHVLVVADAAGLPGSRADEVLRLVGLEQAQRRRVGEYSLGMRQRLSLAVALLGDPQYLILDEPANGLDPQGVAWLREFLRHLASQGRTILISSHVLAEVQLTADDVIIIAAGRLIAAQSLADLEHDRGTPTVRVLSPRAGELAAAISAQYPAVQVQVAGDRITVAGLTAADVGGIAFRSGVELHELGDHRIGLEQLFLEMTTNPKPQGAPPQLEPWQPPTGEPIA